MGPTRRDFLLSSGALLLSMPAAATRTCVPEGPGRNCDANIRTSQFGRVRSLQQTMVWCWAATLQMIFRWHGKQIRQESIVQQVYGAPIQAPASPMALLNSVSRDYYDSHGDSFSVSSEIWGVDYGIAQIDNRTMIEELAANRPLVVCNLSHMMVLVGLNYFEMANGFVRVRQAWVADPFLPGQLPAPPNATVLPAGFRYLMPLEMLPANLGGQLRFVASIEVS